MTTTSRILTGTAALLLIILFAVPLWHIRLQAPQYPEGLGLQIRVGTVTGANPNDLDNINELNHYIGMKRIDPSAIPVLAAMPWAVGVLAAAGLLVALVGRRRLLELWFVGFCVVALVGLGELWWWEYDYGHHIDVAHAIIKVPGMTYQPPFIGSKQLLNFTATSWPALGGWIAALALALALCAIVGARQGRRFGFRAGHA